MLPDRVPFALAWVCRRRGVKPTRFVLVVSLAQQAMGLWKKLPGPGLPRQFPAYRLCRRFVVSTSRLGAGQVSGSFQTPLGLHRIAAKCGGGCPAGTVFRGRQPTRQIRRGTEITHRILRLEGLEPGWNQGGTVDTFGRFIYIHGIGDELSLGRPASRGCIHVAAADLLPLFERMPIGTLVWIAAR
jgi:hypothetical protein